MDTLLRRPGLAGLFAAQTQVAFNDNASKLILIGLVQLLLPAEAAGRVVSAIALLLVAPFVLFAPLSGWLADRFPRRAVLAASLWLQLAVMGLLLAAVAFHSLGLALGGFFLLGCQSALMAPARRGMVKDLAPDGVTGAIAWMEMLAVAAILAGSLAGGFLIDRLAAMVAPWPAAGISLGILVVGCVAALLIFRGVPGHPATAPRPFSRNVLLGHFALLRGLRRDRSIWRAALGDAVFYFIGGILMLTLTQAARAAHPDGHGVAWLTGMAMATVGAGVAVGSLAAAAPSRRNISLGLVPLGAVGMAASFAGLAMAPVGSGFGFVALAGLGMAGGLFLIPLGALLVERAPDGERGSVLAASSLLSSMAGIASVGVFAFLSPWADVGVQFFVLAGISLAAAALVWPLTAQDLLRVTGLVLARLRYSVVAHGTDHLPQSGGVLLVCNHVTYVDTIILSLASPRPVRFLSHEKFFHRPVLGRLLRVFGAIPVSPSRARDGIRRAADHLRRGEVVCIFPEGQLTRTGTLMELKPGFELIARLANCPVTVAHLGGLWGSIFSYSDGRFFTKWPRGLRRRATVQFSAPLPGANSTRVHETLRALAGDAPAAAARASSNVVAHGLPASTGDSAIHRSHQLTARPAHTKLALAESRQSAKVPVLAR